MIQRKGFLYGKSKRNKAPWSATESVNSIYFRLTFFLVNLAIQEIPDRRMQAPLISHARSESPASLLACPVYATNAGVHFSARSISTDRKPQQIYAGLQGCTLLKHTEHPRRDTRSETCASQSLFNQTEVLCKYMIKKNFDGATCTHFSSHNGLSTENQIVKIKERIGFA